MHVSCQRLKGFALTCKSCWCSAVVERVAATSKNTHNPSGWRKYYTNTNNANNTKTKQKILKKHRGSSSGCGVAGRHFVVTIAKKNLYKTPTLGTFDEWHLLRIRTYLLHPTLTFGMSLAQGFHGGSLQSEGPSKHMFWGWSLRTRLPFLKNCERL